MSIGLGEKELQKYLAKVEEAWRAKITESSTAEDLLIESDAEVGALKEALINFIKLIPEVIAGWGNEKQAKELLDNMQQAALDEVMLTLYVFMAIEAQNQKDGIKEFFKGGFLEIRNGSNIFWKLVKYRKHQKSSQEMSNGVKPKSVQTVANNHHLTEVKGSFVKKAKINLIKGRDGIYRTSVSLEQDKGNGLFSLLARLWERLEQLVSGKKSGPYGRSSYLEDNPLKS